MDTDLAPPYSREIQDEAVSYELTDEPVDAMPEGIDEERSSRLHDLALEGDHRVIPELKKLIGRHPAYPVLKNYLSVAYTVAGKERQARALDKECFCLHPDYLFARLALANHNLSAGNLDKARELLGPGLRLANLHTENRKIHVSEWSAYYRGVGLLYAESGELEAAQAILNAFHIHGFGKEQTDLLERHLMVARMKKFRERMDQDAKTEIRVKVPPLARNAGQKKYYEPHHLELEELYEWAADFPDELVTEILALPRESVIRDLIGILDAEISWAPIQMRDGDEGAGWTPVHALFLLSAMEGTEALDVTLRFYGQHPDLLNFWFGDFISWQPVLGIVGGDLKRVADWMKTPDLPYEGRAMIGEALAQIALHRPEKRGEVLAWFADMLAFLRDSPPKDNVLDSRLVSSLVADLIDMRAAELAPLVSSLFAKGYVSELMVGGESDVLRDISSPPKADDRKLLLSMTSFYRELEEPEKTAAPNFQTDGLESLFGGAVSPKASAPDTQPSAGRNDPCPCGSGKKFKKCCM